MRRRSVAAQRREAGPGAHEAGAAGGSTTHGQNDRAITTLASHAWDTEAKVARFGRQHPRAVAGFLAGLVLSCGLAGCGGGAGAAQMTRPTHTTAPGPVASLGATGVAPGFLPDTVTALGDSVMLDYATNLVQDLPQYHVVVDAAVSRQFAAGVVLAQSLRAEHRLGAVVVVALGTNGPVTPAAVSAMAAALAGASRIVFVTVHVDQPWQAEVNATLRAAAAHIPDAVIADWVTLADHHVGWLYPDGTHLPIGGAGARALAALIAHAVRAPTAPRAHTRRRAAPTGVRAVRSRSSRRS